MKRLLLLLTLFSICALSKGIEVQSHLSSEAKISLLSIGEGEEIYALYGHTAIRVHDSTMQIDLVFNYGTFDFNQPHFIWNFIQGRTDYVLSVDAFSMSIVSCMVQNRTLKEQILNLTPKERDALWNALLKNIEPSNRKYRYNFLYNNCSTKPKSIIEQSLDGYLHYTDKEEHTTFRKLLRPYIKNSPWTDFGINLGLGNTIDKEISFEEEMFLPDYLHNAFQTAQIIDLSHTARPLVSSERIWVTKEEISKPHHTLLPLHAGYILLAITLLITLVEWKRKVLFRLWDLLFYCVYAFCGTIIYILTFSSELPGTSPNWNALWLMPFHIIVPILIFTMRGKMILKIYHSCVIVCILLSYIVRFYGIQNIPLAADGFVLALMVRSLSYLRYIRTEKE
ncbi:MAG TPA: hypothetical protein DDY68_01905 [Porphyromonadaceae bacterium]|nr:hypothetical protein [Porphyromonadaceae bacterium]